MPTYDYLCQACGHEFEEFQSITAKPLRKCPKCGKPRLKRLIGTGAGVLFKGSGFYETDYRSQSYKSAAKAERESSGAPSKSEKSAVKPAGPSTESGASKTAAKSDPAAAA
jgi:putative FmdB family regulatory protein